MSVLREKLMMVFGCTGPPFATSTSPFCTSGTKDAPQHKRERRNHKKVGLVISVSDHFIDPSFSRNCTPRSR